MIELQLPTQSEHFDTWLQLLTANQFPGVHLETSSLGTAKQYNAFYFDNRIAQINTLPVDENLLKVYISQLQSSFRRIVIAKDGQPEITENIPDYCGLLHYQACIHWNIQFNYESMADNIALGFLEDIAKAEPTTPEEKELHSHVQQELAVIPLPGLPRAAISNESTGIVIKQRRGRRSAETPERRREIVHEWRKQQGNQLQVLFCQAYGISVSTLRRWIKEVDAETKHKKSSSS